MPVDENNSPENQFVYLPERDQSYTEDRCFLCGVQLGETNRTVEHVFPKWLQREFDLWNEQLHLVNGTLIRYRQLTVPCCTDCNGIHLSRLESDVQKAFDGGAESVMGLDRRVLFLWMAKIYYGLIFRELLLPLNRRSPQQGTIVTADQVKLFRMHHMLLQAARGVVRWKHPEQQPASIFVFHCQTSKHAHLNFDYFDTLNFPYLAIRMGDVAVMAVLQDWKALEDSVTVPQIEAARELQLHPLQFRQIAAVGAYMCCLFNRIPKHISIGGEVDVEVVTMPLGGLSGGGLYNNFDLGEFGIVLASAWQVPCEQIFDGKNLCTLLVDANGNPYPIPWEDDIVLIPTLRKAY